MSIYYHSATYAREHGELDEYRATSKEIIICCRDIEAIISARFDGFRLDRVAIDEALAIHGRELVGLVLASTVNFMAWDGRFSNSNKEWARTVRQLDRTGENYPTAIVETHPAILDGFINLYRNATA